MNHTPRDTLALPFTAATSITATHGKTPSPSTTSPDLHRVGPSA